MNHVYRLKRSGRTQQLQPVPETARAAGKGTRTGKTLAQAVTGTLASFALGGIASLAYAQQAPPASAPTATQLPQGGVVSRGSANIVTNTGQAQLTVNQSSNRAVIDWASFNVGSQAKVQFNQPSSSAVTLNNILGNNASQIYGQISANGQVFLSNPNGVYFSPTAQVNVGGLVATTGKANADEFMAGKASFNRDGSTGSVVNQGQLTSAAGGYIALLAPEVRNQGVVVAQAGTVALASGEAITLNFNHTGTGLAGITTTPQAIAALVENRSAVLAEGGQIILSAHALASLQGAVVKNSGQLSATSLSTQGGKIVLMGDSIALTGTSQIQASGATGGGTVLVGGDWQGSGDTRQATKVTMAQGGSIEANATGQGDGGKVVLWSAVDNPNSLTEVHGVIMAEGGAQGGHGGKVETSGYQLNVSGLRVSTDAALGNTGNWLLDPYNITINATGPTSNVTGTYTANGAGTVILVSDLVTALNSNNVTVATGSTGGESGHITIADPISWSSTRTLTLNAAGSIYVNAAVSTAKVLTLNAGDSIFLNAAVSWTSTNANSMSWTATSGGLSGTGNIVMSPGQNGTKFSINQGGNSTYEGVISGHGDFTKAGVGKLILTGNNTYDGDNNLNTHPTWVSAGTLQVGNGGTSGSLGSGYVFNEGTLAFNRTDAQTLPYLSGFNYPYAYSTGLTQFMAGTWKITSNNGAFNGLLEVASGAVLDTNGNTYYSTGLTGGGTVTNSSATTGSLSISMPADTQREFTGQITGKNTVTMSSADSATQILSGTNSYNQFTSIYGGTLVANNATALGVSSVLINAAAGKTATLAIGGVNLGNSVTTQNTGNGDNIIKSLSGTSELSGYITTATRPVIFSAAPDTTLLLSRTFNGTTIANKFRPDTGAEILITAPITSSAGSKLILEGPGKLTLAGNNSAGNFTPEYATNTTGTIRLASNTALGNATGITVPEGATLELGKLDNSNLTIANKTLILASSSNTSGGGQIVNLQGNNEWSGTVTLNNNSEVTVNANSSLNLSSTLSTVASNSRAYFDLNGDLTFGALVGGAGATYLPTGSGALSTNTLSSLLPIAGIYARLNTPTGVFSSVYGEAPIYSIGFYTAASGGTLVSLSASDYTGYNAVSTFSGMPSNASIVGVYSVNYTSGVTVSNANYQLMGPGSATSWTVTPKTLMLNIPGASRIYDGTTAISATGSVTLLGVVNGDAVSFGGSVNGFVDKHVGSNKAVTYTGSSLTGAGIGNYILPATPNSNADISAKAVTFSGLSSANKTYDGTTTATVNGSAVLQSPIAPGTGSSSDGAAYTNDVLSLSGTVVGTFNSKNVLDASTVSFTGISLAGADAGNYTLTPHADANHTISAKALTLSGLSSANKTYDGTTTATVNGSAVLQSSIAPGTGSSSDGTAYTNDVLSLSGTVVGTFNSKNVLDASTVSFTGISLAGADAGNYTLTPHADANHTISAKELIISGITAQSKTYDGSTAATVSTANVVKSGLIVGDVVTVTASGTFSDANVGAAKSVNLLLLHGGADAVNYSFADQATATADISATVTTDISATVTAAPTPQSPPVVSTLPAISASRLDPANIVPSASTQTQPVMSPGLDVNLVFLPASVSETSAFQVPGEKTVTSSTVRGSIGMESQLGDVEVTLVSAPSTQNQGLITVVLPKGSVQETTEIVIFISEQVGEFAAGLAASDVTVSLPNNLPLPSWIRYSAIENAFILKAVPNGALPMLVAMTFKDVRFLVRISESGMVN